MSESQKICVVNPLARRGMVSGGGGWMHFSASIMFISTSFLCWLEMVRLSTVSRRSRQNAPSIFTLVKVTGV